MFDSARRLLEEALQRRAFPAAVIEAGRLDGALWTEAFGRLRFAEDAPHATPETIFDLASLTKVMATTCLVQREVTRAGDLSLLEAPLSGWLPEWRDGGAIRLRHLLDHSSGLAAHVPFWIRGTRGRDDYLHAIACRPRLQPPGTRAVYSDLGFMLLGFALESRRGLPLSTLFEEIAADLEIQDVRFLPPPSWRPRTAPTEIDPWRGRLLIGEVHDENAWALGGVAGHAGLFGAVGGVGAFARAVLRSFQRKTPFSTPAISRHFANRTGVLSSSRALGWDTMLPTSSCGRLMSETAIGHTGFTGTSLWIDWERDLYVALLTNRVHPTRENDQLQQLRPALHDAIVQDAR